MEHIEKDRMVLSGRTFIAPTKTSFRQDMFVLDLAKGAGVEKLSNATETDLSEAAEELLLRAWKSGKLFLLLAGMIVEEGKEWTEESAKANAEFFADLTDLPDKEALSGAITGVLISFFVNAEGFSKISQTSSRADKQGISSAGKRRSRAGVGTGATVTSATGTKS